jgi:membrane protein
MVNLADLLENFCRKGIFYFRLVARRFVNDGCQHSAAALTYMTLFALVPLLTVLFTVLSLVPSFAGLSDQIEQVILDNMLPNTGAEIFAYLREFSSQARRLSGPGIILLIVTAYLMLVNIEKVFNRIWETPGRRTGISSFLVYWAVLSLGPLLLGAGLMINTYLVSLQFLTENQDFSGYIYALLEYLPWLMTALAFTLLYKAVPNRQVYFKNAIIGGLVATLVFEAAKALFGFIVSNSSFKSVYGAFSIVPLFLLWTYLSWMIILAGAEFVRATETFASEVGGRTFSKSQALFMALSLLHKAQLKGLGVSDRRMTASGLHSQQWHELRDLMLARNVITTTQSGRYVLTRDLSQTSVWELLDIIGNQQLRATDPMPEDLIKHHPWITRYNELMQSVRGQAQGELSLSVADLLGAETEDDK